MSKRWIVIILFVSLAFNLAVLSVFLYTSYFNRMPFCLYNERSDKDLSEHRYSREDRERERPEFTLGNRDEIKQLRSEFMQKRREFIITLNKETVNEQEVMAAMQASLKAQEKLESMVGTSMLELRKKMTPEQAKDYFQKILDRKKDHRPDYDRSKIIKQDNTQ
ncbi:MAG: periplasmic heavy metal sensor [Candidatus Cloacimonadaceae bacterium]